MALSVSQKQPTTTVTFDGDLTLAGPLTKIIDAKVGFSVEESKFLWS
jgi:hypothetical protein